MNGPGLKPILRDSGSTFFGFRVMGLQVNTSVQETVKAAGKNRKMASYITDWLYILKQIIFLDLLFLPVN